MPKLSKYTLEYNEKKEKWDLKKDETHQVVKSFPTKEDATKGGVLKTSVGTSGGSVKIQKQDGHFEEERTYPPSADPHRSKG